jgi:hypothetical protein
MNTNIFKWTILIAVSYFQLACSNELLLNSKFENIDHKVPVSLNNLDIN